MCSLNLTSVVWRRKGLVPVVINNKMQYNTGEGRQMGKKKKDTSCQTEVTQKVRRKKVEIQR